MKGKNYSPDKLKQAKITAFCATSNSNLKNVPSQINRNRKRKKGEISEVYGTPTKKLATSDCTSPDIFSIRKPQNSDDNCLEKKTKNDLENFEFVDFENDPFLSPKKKESPEKNILAENFSGNITRPEEKSEINFDSPIKCRVVKVNFFTEKIFEQSLLLNDVKLNKTGVCKLRDVWTSLSLSVDDIVCIQAAYSGGDWIVDNKNGYVIIYPDILISSSTLTRSMFCLRQGILSHFFKNLNPENQTKMILGRLVHELFQESLKTTFDSDDDFGKIIKSFMKSRSNLEEFFFNGINTSDIQKELENFIPHVRKFLDIYVKSQEAPTGKNYSGTIDSVVDIEELIKSPVLGFQGRVDVTVKLRKAKAEKIAPLEIKTGRASFSQEHRSQLTLYVLLMNELGREVDSGLLLYLKENIIEEILPQRDEIKNLFLLRNHFVKYFKLLAATDLPEPIRNVKSCIKCSHLRICTSYLRGKECEEFSKPHPLVSIEIPDVKPSHVDYFLKWNKMLFLEYEDILEEMTDDIVTSHYPKLSVESNVKTFKEEFKCTFRKPIGSKIQEFRPGSYVNVMNGKRNRVCSGRVVEVTDSFISVLIDKKLDTSDSYTLNVFKSKFVYFYLSNLGWLLNEEFEVLRELIIDKKEPKFDQKFDKTDFQEKCLKYLLFLNKEQQKAVLKALLCQDYLLIKGPPGTGKTQTIVILIKILLALNKTVLVASHTHSSVDNVLLKLDGIEYLRFGLLKSIHEEVRKNAYSFLIESCSSLDDVKKLFDRKLMASTCMGIDSDFVRKIKVEYCIIDESSQVLQPEILRPLFCCKKFILVGDEDQLPPIVRNFEAKKLGMDLSMFEWLSNDLATVRLKLQYRMNSVINSLANALAYDGLIECGNEKVANATIKISNREIFAQENEWIVDILSDDLEKSVIFVDTSEYFKLKNIKLQDQRCSVIEANIIVRLITTLIKYGVKEGSIGVIAPFWDQITLLAMKLAKANLKGVELNTVDQYQGRDKEVILISCTKENQANKEATVYELLSDKRRLTVAVTRAKQKLIIVGDKETVNKYKPFQVLLRSMNEAQFFYLLNGQKNFFWENFVL